MSEVEPSTIEVEPEVVALMVLFGFARKADDGVHELTEAGSKWLREWCAERRKT